jgi:hypothetical protein
MFGAAPVSLDAPLPDGDGETVADLVSDADGLSAWHGQPTDAVADVERRLDVERALGSIGRRDAELCACVSEGAVDAIPAGRHGSRPTVYRRLRELRHVLATLGLSAA